MNERFHAAVDLLTAAPIVGLILLALVVVLACTREERNDREDPDPVGV